MNTSTTPRSTNTEEVEPDSPNVAPVTADPWAPVVPFDRAARSAQEELRDVMGRFNAAQIDLIALTERVIDEELWEVGGVRSVQHWLTCFAGLSPSRASDVVRIARRSHELPAMRARLDAGELTLDQAAVVARHTPPTHDAEVAEFAGHATVTQLRRTLSRYSFAETGRADGEGRGAESASDDEQSEVSGDGHGDPSGEGGDGSYDGMRDGESGAGSHTAVGASGQRSSDGPSTANLSDGKADPDSGSGSSLGPRPDAPDPQDPAAQPSQVRLEYRDGRFHLEFSAPAEVGALVEQALREAKNALFHAGHPHATVGAAMEEMAARSLEQAGRATESRLGLYRVYIHLAADRTGWLQAGPALPEHAIRRITCNGSLQTVWEREGKPVSVGRSERIVPDRTRRLVEDRDRGCRYPGCHSRYHLEVHHVVHWRDGGPTDTTNLVCLCSFHHDAHHRGEFRIAGDADKPNGPAGLRFTTRAGGPIGPVGAPPAGAGSSAPPEGREPGRTAPKKYPGPSGDRLRLRDVDFGRGSPPGHVAPTPPDDPPPRDTPPDDPLPDGLALDGAPPDGPQPDGLALDDPSPNGIPPGAWIYAEADGCTYWAAPDPYQSAGEDADLTGAAALAHVRAQRSA